jgi:hypothetical protein
MSAESDIVVAREILAAAFPWLDGEKMENALQKSVKRCPIGRIIEFDLSGDLAGTGFRVAWDLPPSITRLDQLKTLVLMLCLSIPAELASMKSLNTLKIWTVIHTLTLPTVDFPNLKHIIIHRSPLPVASLLVLSEWMGRCLVNLETIFIIGSESFVDVMLVIFGASDSDLAFQNTLKYINIKNSGMVESDLAYFLRRVATRTTALRAVTLEDNDVQSLQKVSREIALQVESDPSHPLLRSKLQVLNLKGNPVMKKLMKTRTQPETAEDRALITLMKVFPRNISFLPLYHVDPKNNNGLFEPPYASSKVEAFLRLKWGRVHRLFGGSESTDGHHHKLERYISMGLWPTILEWTYAQSDVLPEFSGRKDATALYHMIRHSPTVVGRTHLFKNDEESTSKGGDSASVCYEHKEEDSKPASRTAENGFGETQI